MRKTVLPALLLIVPTIGCGPSDDPGDPVDNKPSRDWECVLTDSDLDWADEVGCAADFDLIASEPLDSSIPGARSSKTVLDLSDSDRFYFINSQKYLIHYDFVSAVLTGAEGLPPIGDLAGFNTTEYFSPERRFVLGAITYYEEPDVWAYEIAPYDTASPEFIAQAYNAIVDNAYFGEDLFFHPSSEVQEKERVPELPPEVNVITTDELFAGITYQPLNLGCSTGLLTFHTAEEVDGTPIYYREIAVLDAVPNDIGIVAAIITDAFQTPLSHINVLSQNRGSPNMALIGAYEDPTLRALENKWVELCVEGFDWGVKEITAEEAEEWWQLNKPEPLDAEPMDLSITELMDAEDLIDQSLTLSEAIAIKIPAFGGKMTHFGGLALIGEECPVPDAFGVPMFYYNQFMEQNGFWGRVDSWLDPMHPDHDPLFLSDPLHRQEQLELLQADMQVAPIDGVFIAELEAKLNSEFPGERMRFRSSTNAEDLGEFTGAGLYTSNSGTPGDPNESVEDAVRATWSSVWNPRAYDERDYYSIDHTLVGMALLVHRSFPFEEVNGVAITNNIFDTTGYEPAFYINAQIDDWSVVLPEIGVTSDQILYYYDQAGQPVVYIGHSSLIPSGWTVMDTEQLFMLGTALASIRQYFMPAYGDRAFYAMDTEFKFEDDFTADGSRQLFMKQARPYPGRE
jgi:hypothetical protein